MAMDADDGLEQIMNSVWSQSAQTVERLHRAFSQGVMNVERAHERHQQERDQLEKQRQYDLRMMEEQRMRLYEWETTHKHRLHDGYEAVLNTAILSGRVSELSDKDLIKAWVIGNQLDGTDPGYAAKLAQARSMMDTEWSHRHHATNLAAVADVSVNHSVITYCDRSVELEETLNAFQKADIPVDVVRADDVDQFKQDHGGNTFCVSTRYSGDWDGYDADMLQEAIMQDFYSDMDSDRVEHDLSWLNEQRFDESTPHDRLSTGLEPSTVSEVEHSETANGAATSPTIPSETTGDTSTEKSHTHESSGLEQDNAVFDMNTVELGGDDVFGSYSVAEESALATQEAQATLAQPFTHAAGEPVIQATH